MVFITVNVWKIYNGKIGVVAFVMESGRSKCQEMRQRKLFLFFFYLLFFGVYKRYTDGQPGIHATDIITPAVCLRC